MAAELSVTAKGQITLKRSVLNHLGVQPGQRVGVNLLPNGRVELIAADAPKLSSLRGILKRPGQRVVSVEEMQDAIEASASNE